MLSPGDSQSSPSQTVLAEEFGLRLYAEAWQRGWAHAEKKVVIGDGADWIWNIVQLHFPDATQIVDLYHARQHLWELAAKLYPNDSPHHRRWMMTKQDKLDYGKIESLVAPLRSLASSHPGLAKQIRTEADYFQTNAERMRYPKFRRQKLFWGDRSWVQNDHWDAAQTVRHVLDRARSQRHHRSTGNPVEVDLTYMSREQARAVSRTAKGAVGADYPSNVTAFFRIFCIS